jgi:hypothetical protein
MATCAVDGGARSRATLEDSQTPGNLAVTLSVCVPVRYALKYKPELLGVNFELLVIPGAYQLSVTD